MRTLQLLVIAVVIWSSASFVLGFEDSPRVVEVWAAGPMETRVAFDRPVDAGLATRVVGQTIAFGEGEKPGIAGRLGGDRGTIRVAGARLVDAGRTLVLVTDPHPRETSYRLTLPGVRPSGDPATWPPVALTYNLGGVEAVYTSKDARWSGWWPTVDPAATRQSLASSAEHERLFGLLTSGGSWTLQTLVTAPRGEVTLTLESSVPFEATFGVETAKSTASSSKPEVHQATLKAESTGDAVFLLLSLTTSAAGWPEVRASIGAGPLPRSAFVLPWAPPATASPSPPAVPRELLTGGDPSRGESVFFSEQARCATCHQVRGKGGVIGPDLSTLVGRDRAWVYQNIIDPSASLHPDFVSFTVSLKDGRVAMGVVRAEGQDALKVADIEAKQTVIPRAEVEEIRPSASSVMPVGLLGAIGEEKTRDLLAYLIAPLLARPKE